tara:strand:+ start:3301 stop:3891 length:591 start_codon:yes stop_codon:yes gene_type:complete
MTEKIKPRDKPHYVNNRDFSYAIVDYIKLCRDEEANGNDRPKVTDYIATCFMKICEGLSHKSNFVRYTYRDEMVMDGVENCLRAIHNYNIDTITRTGKPNAFSYFTQIAYFAFIRRITKEKKQQDIKFHFLEQADIESFITSTDVNNPIDQAYVDVLRNKIASIKKKDSAVKEFGKQMNKKKKEKGLELFYQPVIL